MKCYKHTAHTNGKFQFDINANLNTFKYCQNELILILAAVDFHTEILLLLKRVSQADFNIMYAYSWLWQMIKNSTTYSHNFILTFIYFFLKHSIMKIKSSITFTWLKTNINRLFPTHFAVIVEVRVKAHTVPTSGLQVDQRRWVGIILGKIHIKLEATIGIWGVSWACDENL